MADTSIEWTDKTWNPTSGCRAYSPGCANCYAATMTRRLEAMGQKKYAGLLRVLPDGGKGHFNGIVRPDEDSLTIPLRWKKPCRVFVNSMSDLFYGDEADARACESAGVEFTPVPFDFIDKVFAVMALCPQHTFQVLTKRPGRMAEWFAAGSVGHRIYQQVGRWLDDGEDGLLGRSWDHAHQLAGASASGGIYEHTAWNVPLKNVWLGTSIENQEQADKRSEELRCCPAAVRFYSIEPMLGSINKLPLDGISWVIVGSESGAGRRPMKTEWAESIRDQCRSAGVPFFMKQMSVNGRISGDIELFPKSLQIREFPRASTVASSV